MRILAFAIAAASFATVSSSAFAAAPAAPAASADAHAAPSKGAARRAPSAAAKRASTDAGKKKSAKATSPASTTASKQAAKESPKADTKDATKVAAREKGTPKDATKIAATEKTKTLPALPPLVPVSTRARTQHASEEPKPPCLRTAVELLAPHVNESDTFALTRCDGSPAPGAVEHLSVAARPGSAAKPAAPIADLVKTSGALVAPGVRRMDSLLVEHLQAVLDHFSKDGKAPRVDVVSGYRPSSTGSYHASGRALDFRLEGVANEELVAFCKTLDDTGCGYYPNSSFVHMDVRDPGVGHVTWIDASGPGETPRYVAQWPLPAAPAADAPPGREEESALQQLERLAHGELPPTPIDEHP